MHLIKRYRIEILFVCILLIVYFVSRLITILSVPIFTDEAIYVRWSQIAKDDANWRFISLTDGKSPSFVWIAMTIMRVVTDPLLASRLVSVMAGFLSMIGLFFLGQEVFKNRWVGLLSSFLYLIFPMAVVYDRMALYDSLVGTFAVWGLYLIILLIRLRRLDVALLLGMVAGGGVLTKTNGFFTIYLLPFSFLLFDFRQKEKVRSFLKLIGLCSIAVGITYALYSVQRLSPFFYLINGKNALFVYPIREWLEHPTRFLLGNLAGEWNWFITYVTWPVLALMIAAFVIRKTFLREKILLVIWFFVPFFLLALFGKVLYPRFIFFMILPLLPLVAYSLVFFYQKVRNKLLFTLILIVLFSAQIYSSGMILFNFERAPFPAPDEGQYINDWPAGGGIPEIVQFLQEEAKTKKIFVGTQGTFGLLPYALEIYLVKNPNIKIQGYWPTDATPPKDLLDQAKKTPTYVVFYQPCVACQHIGDAPTGWPVEEVGRYYKGRRTDRYITLYRIIPK